MRRLFALLSSLVLALLTPLAPCGCVGGSDPSAPAATGEPTGSASAPDDPCVPQTRNQGCYGRRRMWCEDTTASWQQLGACPADMRCIELPDPTLPGAYLAKCDDLPAPAAGGTDGGGGGGGSALEVCKRWLTDRDGLTEGEWSGSKAKCDPGELSADAKDAALRLVNLYRYLSHMPAVVRDPELDARAQKCSLMMYANGAISHFPPPSWKCYSEAGALAAKRSNLSTGPGVTAVDRYMIDSGANNHDTLGHRRWILSASLDRIGVGSSASKGSCLWVIGGKGHAARKWTAWPPDGKVPLAAFAPHGRSIDQTGWSLQSDSVSFAKAKVVVSQGGRELKTKQWPLKGGYGSTDAIAWVPVGWHTEAGKTYRVELQGSSADFWYEVEVLGCTE